ncbi:MAG: hypothetical protein C0408_11105, partial [Odoribacter sp.]|nr:hypothetical protein [Odoribacter sp.]
MTIYPVPGHVKISSDQSVNASSGVYWVCEGVTLIVLSSPGTTFLLEKHASIIFSGGSGDLVYAKDSCSVTNNSSDDVGVTCNPATVIMSNTGSGSITVVNTCTPVIYDYSLLPGGAGPCGGLAGVPEEINSKTFSLFPNPVKSESEVFFVIPPDAIITGLF